MTEVSTSTKIAVLGCALLGVILFLVRF